MKKFIILTALLSLSITKVVSQTWSPVGTGIGSTSYSVVYCITSYDSSVIAGGSFSSAGGIAANNIAKWNGTNWSPLGTGINGSVNSLCVYNAALYAGGNFTVGGGTPAIDIARWNGTSWVNVGTPDCYSIQSMAVYNGELYAAGYFVGLTSPEGTSIAKWNGSSWSAVGGGPEPVISHIECLAVYNGELYAAGADIAGGGGGAGSYSVVKWNGTVWNTILTIPPIVTLDGTIGDILSMAVYNGELYIAGMFNMIGTMAAKQIARWNGVNWSGVGTGITPAAWPAGGPGDGSTYSFVASLTEYNGTLFAGGRFDSCGTVATRNIARWDGTNWSAVGQGVNNYVFGISSSAYDSFLYAGGLFNYVNTNVPADKIAKWGCNNLPDQPLVITGSQLVCIGTVETYSVPPSQGATTYTWTLPQGWSGNSLTNSINVITGPNSGYLTVHANNQCGASPSQNIPVNVVSLPAQPPGISGIDSVCYGTQQHYYVGAVNQATSYTWQLPQGWTGSSTINLISVMVGTNSGTISVTANNICGGGLPRVFAVTSATPPSQPTVIIGDDSAYIGQSLPYSIATVPGAESYNWSVTGGTIVSGQGSTHINATWTQAGNRSISVNATNYCGAGINQTKSVTVSVITGMSGWNEANSRIILPGRSSHSISLNLQGYSNQQVKLQIFNPTGQLVYTTQFRDPTGTMQEINLANMLPGVYIVNLLIEKRTFSQKVVLH